MVTIPEDNLESMSAGQEQVIISETINDQKKLHIHKEGAGYNTLDPHAPRMLPDGKVASRLTSFIIRGTRLPSRLQKVVAEYESTYLVPIPRGAGVTTIAAGWKPQWKQIFSQQMMRVSSDADLEIVIEVGSGMGDQAVHYAIEHPEKSVLALEVWDEGRAQTMRKAQSVGGIDNLRLLFADATIFLPLLEPNSIAEVWTFFPDPWRKARHHRRRLVRNEFAQAVYRAIKPGGVWRIATDWDNYAQSITQVIQDSQFIPVSGGEADFIVPRWTQRIMTKFEAKGLAAGRQIFDFSAYKPNI